MRFLTIKLALLIAVLVSACNFWPRELESFAESVNGQVGGETTAWLVGGDVLLIDVAGSPLYAASQAELETRATGIAEQAIEAAGTPLESIVMAFHEGEVSADEEETREFIFVVIEGRPVLQPNLDFEATGPLTRDEIEAAVGRMGETLAEDQVACVRGQVEQRARVVGDPEYLDPANVEFLTPETWNALDAFGKRLILVQALTTEAVFACASAL